MSLSDEALARLLQAEFDEEDVPAVQSSAQPRGSSNHPLGPSSSKPMSLVDTQWELLDPTPDPRALFLEFNSQFFWGKLAGVEVRWSPRMTLCAGVCSYEGFGGLCSIRLSTPLLKLRPRKDLVETLLHEMIHAYLFVTQNNRDRDGHGPEFCKHMSRINTEAGTTITIYHSFHDEVENYRQHWWRCDGPCKSRKPYFGYVKRAMNRAPSPRDTWWARHQQSCGGTYTKVKEPDGYGQKKRKKGNEGDSEKENEEEASANKKQKRESQDIRNFIPFTGQGHRIGGPSSSSKDPTDIGGRGSIQTAENGKPVNGTVQEANTSQSCIDQIDKKRPDGSQQEQVGEGFFRSRDANTKQVDSKGTVKKGFDLAKREKKLEELRSIFVSDSEDEEETDGGRVKNGSKKPKHDPSSSIDKDPRWEGRHSGDDAAAGGERPRWGKHHSVRGSHSEEDSRERSDSSDTSSWRKRVPKEEDPRWEEKHSGNDAGDGRPIWGEHHSGDRSQTRDGSIERSDSSDRSSWRMKVPKDSGLGSKHAVLGGEQSTFDKHKNRHFDILRIPSSRERSDSSDTSSQRRGVPKDSLGIESRHAIPGGKQTTFGGGSSTSDSRSRIEEDKNRHFDSSGIPSGSHVGSTPLTRTDQDGGGTLTGGHRGGTLPDGGIQRAKHPSGQPSLDNFLNRSQGSNVLPGRHHGGEAIPGRSGPVQGSGKRVKCPVCAKEVIETEINSHLDSCLSGFS